jgi:uncharacterized protein YbaP (TraB family)
MFVVVFVVVLVSVSTSIDVTHVVFHPVTENMSILKGDPVKAFLNQDHQAHIAVHMSMMQDPLIAASIGQNPKAPVISAALMAHVAEHAGYQYRKQIEAQLGRPQPPED